MRYLSFQQTLSRTLSLGAAGITAFLITGTVTDPVNAPKLFLLGGLGGAAFFLVGYLVVKNEYRMTGLEVLIMLFLFWGVLTLTFSSSPITQGFYGVYGRNTGFLAYAFLGLVAIAGSQLIGRARIEYVLWGFLIALGVNLAYGLWVIFFGDFLGWQNIYGALLGTFGNPNFISSFLGLGFSLVLALSFRFQLRLRLTLILFLPLIAWQLSKAGSVQGIVVAMIGAVVVGYFWLRDKSERMFWPATYLASCAAVASFAVSGVFGTGPFKQLFSQPTIALREQYWLAAVNMAKSHPFFGVGMDSYGDWYRRARSPQALVTPGPDTVTNTAHNVFLDVFASGGYPLLTLYILITVLGAYSLLRNACRSKTFDPVFVGITVLWVGYQAQSMISINQIGLAIWGWLINGVAISFEYSSRTHDSGKLGSKPWEKGMKNRKNETFSPQLLSFLGVVAGLLIAVPPLSADAKWRDVQLSGQVDKVEPALRGSFMSPINSYRLAEAVQLLERSQLPDIAIRYARKGIEFNPNYFDAWRFLYFSTNATPEEKRNAKTQMIRLDPLNPAWKELS